MQPEPIYDDKNYKGSGKLKGKNALITGGDSGIGRAVAVAFAKEGANVAIAYLDEQEDADAEKTVKLIQNYGGKALKSESISVRKNIASNWSTKSSTSSVA